MKYTVTQEDPPEILALQKREEEVIPEIVLKMKPGECLTLEDSYPQAWGRIIAELHRLRTPNIFLKIRSEGGVFKIYRTA